VSDDLFDLTGKVAIVTGSTRGIGRAIATRFAQRGAQVVVSSRDAAACEAVAQELREAGGQAIGIAAHVGKKEQLENLVTQTVERCGGVDVLVCNAAVNPYYGPLSGISDDAYDRIMSSNVRSALWLSNLSFPHMAERGGGSAIFLSSIAGLSGTNVLGAYAVSKTALIGLARSLSRRVGAGRNSRQLSGAGDREDRVRARVVGQPVDRRSRRRAHRAAAAGRRRRRRRSGGVPRVARRRVRHRSDDS
jgi:dehydrogenase/reductase SDR family protein 4